MRLKNVTEDHRLQLMTLNRGVATPRKRQVLDDPMKTWVARPKNICAHPDHPASPRKDERGPTMWMDEHPLRLHPALMSEQGRPMEDNLSELAESEAPEVLK